MTKDFYTILLSFQNYMQALGYDLKPREKLVSPIFKTTFTLSGGPNLAVDYLENKNLKGDFYIHQPCIRHWDSKLVGDGKHLSFFNMLVTASIDGFDRKIIFLHHLEYIKNHLGFDLSKIYATYFAGGNVKGEIFLPDDEAKRIWLDLGIHKNHIIPCSGEKAMEAFVANSVEPVGGYRSELFYDDRGMGIESVDNFFELVEKGDILEFWTHVDYNCKVFVDESKKNYSFEKIDLPIHAAGFGPRRVMRIMEGMDRIEDISIFDTLKSCLGRQTDEVAKSVVMDHIRGLVFLINDGAADLSGQKNRSRRYVFKKYVEHLRNNYDTLNIPFEEKRNVVDCLVEESIGLFSILFPEFAEKKNDISQKVAQLLEV